MTPYLLETLDKLEPHISPEALSILNRQRRETMLGSKKYAEWNSLIEKTGFKINEARNVYPNNILIDIWNIGLRPISHLLIRMSENLSKEQFTKIKEEWVDIFHKLFKPLLTIRSNYEIEKAPYLIFEVTKC